MTPAMWPARYRLPSTAFARCAICGLAQRIRDLDEIGHGRWLCNEDTATPLCHRRRVELGAARAEPVTSPQTSQKPKEVSK